MAETRKIDEGSLSDLRKEVVRLRGENKRLEAQKPRHCAVYSEGNGKITERCVSLDTSGTFLRCMRHGCAVGFSDFCSMYRKREERRK